LIGVEDEKVFIKWCGLSIEESTWESRTYCDPREADDAGLKKRNERFRNQVEAGIVRFNEGIKISKSTPKMRTPALEKRMVQPASLASPKGSTLKGYQMEGLK
jgi:hypothetical protein